MGQPIEGSNPSLSATYCLGLVSITGRQLYSDRHAGFPVHDEVGLLMRNRRLIGFSALLVSLMLASLAPMSVSAASPTRFGAKLTHHTQPTPRERCSDTVGTSEPSTCTWVAVEAFENGDHEKAPKNGYIGKVRIVSCIGGSFTVQVARAHPSDDEAKIVRSGPTLSYDKDTQSGGCGGEDGDNYKIQSFRVHLLVSKGDYIAVKGTKIGFIHNSSSGDALVFHPKLPTGGSYREADTSTGGLLIQFEYAS